MSDLEADGVLRAGPVGFKGRAREDAPPWEGKAAVPSPVELLRAFDLNSRYGPSKDLSRRERWERAKILGLDPAPEVPALLEAAGGHLDVSNWDTLQGKDL